MPSVNDSPTLGQIDPDSMLQKLEATAMEWAEADPDRKVLPALHLIAVVAQDPFAGRRLVGVPERDTPHSAR